MREFVVWWQHLPERIDPVFLQIGAVQIRYYGLMYLCSFLVAYGLLCYRIKTEKSAYTKLLAEDYVTWAIAGVLIGARLGYVVFYNLNYFLSHPLEIFWPVHIAQGQTYFGISGMSYHGGLLGIIIATILFCRRNRLKVLAFCDLVVPAVPLGYMFGRIGNFLNGELYGRVTDKWWGMYFANAPTYELRHPSQLYEAFFEGIVLFLILWPLRRKKMFEGALLFIYMIGYGTVRFLIEFLREPDAQIGFLLKYFSMGQILCLVMIAIGGIGLIKFRNTRSSTP